MFQNFFHKNEQGSLKLDNIKAIFFDLDGTLIDVDMNLFVPGYLRRLTGRMSAQAKPSHATRAMHSAVAAMFANTDREKTLETILLETLYAELAVTPQQYADSLEHFYLHDLDELQPMVNGYECSARLVDASLARGWQVVLATNPIFPRKVVDARVNWGKLEIDSFHHVTAYETAHFCKPSPAFFTELLDCLQLEAKHCLMVGNDTLHDLAASQVGMQTCLLTPWLIRRPGCRFRPDWQGRHEELLALIDPGAGASHTGGCPD